MSVWDVNCRWRCSMLDLPMITETPVNSLTPDATANADIAKIADIVSVRLSAWRRYSHGFGKAPKKATTVTRLAPLNAAAEVTFPASDEKRSCEVQRTPSLRILQKVEKRITKEHKGSQRQKFTKVLSNVTRSYSKLSIWQFLDTRTLILEDKLSNPKCKKKHWSTMSDSV